MCGDTKTGSVHQCHDVFDKTQFAASAEFGFGIFEHQFAGGRPFDTHFVFDTANGYTAVVAVVDEHGESASVFGSFFGTGQHECNVSVTVGDEPFHSVEIPAAVGLAVCGFEHDGLQVGTGIGFGEVHRHSFAGTNARQVFLLLFFIGKFVNGFGAVLQSPDVYESGIGAAYHVGSHDVGNQREVEPVVATGDRDTHQSGFYQSVEVFLRAFGIYDMSVDNVRTFVVYVFGIGCNDFAAYLACYFEHFFITIHGVFEIEGRIVVFFGIGVIPFP